MNLPSKPKQFHVTLRDIAYSDTIRLRLFLRLQADDRCDRVNDLHDNTPQLLGQLRFQPFQSKMRAIAELAAHIRRI
jgi:hypothetical protein